MEEIIQLLKIKLENEFSKYADNIIKNYTPEQILKKSYETTVKEQLKDEITNRDLSKEQIRALLKTDNLLDEFYNDWLDEDSRLGEILENSIDTTLDIVETNFNKVKNNRNIER